MRTANKIVMTLAGLLLIAAAVLKFHEMIDTCVPSWDAKAEAVMTKAAETGETIPQTKAKLFGFWESYEFLLFQIPLEFALGVWMVCGLFRKAAWIAGTLAYLGFIFVTLTKAMLGVESCGCFGQIHVDPWITLFAIDIPFFLLLTIFRPKGYKLLPPPWPNMLYLLAVAIPTIAVMVLAAPAMVTLRPDCITADDAQPDEAAQLKLQVFKLKQELQKQTQQIENLKQQLQDQKQPLELKDALEKLELLKQQLAEKQQETQTTVIEVEPVQQELPTTEVQEAAVETTPATEEAPAVEQWEWLQFVVEDDVREQISQGLVVVMMNRFDCPVCEDMAPRYSDYYKEMVDQGIDEFKIAFLAIPPYGETDHVPDDTICIEGKLTDERDWGLMSPYVVALLDGELVKTWQQGTAPEPENILAEIFGE